MTDTIPATVKTQHTALPWVIDKYGHVTRGRECVSANGFSMVMSSGDRQNEAKANAAFIVRACNSHYQLVSALRGLVNALAENDEDGMTEFSDDMVRARAALSQAGGE